MSLAQRISNFRSRIRLEQEIDAELQSHIEMRIEDNLRAGMSAPEARRIALLQFGNRTSIKENMVSIDSSLRIEQVIRDLRYTFRQLGKNPLFAATVISTIALGIGATIGVFSIVHSVLLRPLPYKNSDRLVVAYGDMRKRNATDLRFSSPDFLDLRNGAKSMFEGFAGVETDRMLLERADGSVEQIRTANITPNFFGLMGGRVILGRDLRETDGLMQTQTTDTAARAAGGGTVSPPAILSYEYWQRRYGGSPAIIGQHLSSGADRGPEIVGVLAPKFELLFPPSANVERLPDVWIAAHLNYEAAQRKTMIYRVVGRLKDGASLANAQSEVDGIAAELRSTFPIWQTSDWHIELQPMHQYLVAGLKPSILALMAAAAFLLLIGCANVANLLLVRMSLRERELALRTALGGGRWDLIRQVLVEACLFAATGTLLGLGLAWAGLWELSRVAPLSQPLLRTVRIDPAVLVFTPLFGLCAALIFGVIPALYVSRPALMTVLRTGGRNSLLAGGKILRSSMVVTEIALSFALLVGAGLMLRSFVRLENIDPGFDAHGILTFQVLWPDQPNPQKQDALIHEVQDSLRAIPGVMAVTAATPFPLADQFSPIRWGTEQAMSDATKFQAADFQIVLPGYFETLRTPLLAGRTFREADNSEGRSLVIIDQLLASKAFPRQSAIGKRILIRLRTPEPEWAEVIGVVAHQRDTSLADLGREELYVTDGFMGHGFATRWGLRVTGDPAHYDRMVREHLAKLGTRMVLTEVRPMDALLEESQATTRLSLALIAAFACIAVLLAALGIYGVLSTAVRQRTAEIGVRMALGATRGQVFGLVVRLGLALGISGILAGCLIALLLARWIRSILVETKPTDPLTYMGITAAFLLVVGLASWLPARRAASVDPMQALRSE
jgi:putative ABC transport system permease protein